MRHLQLQMIEFNKNCDDLRLISRALTHGRRLDRREQRLL